jgi:copper chaperone CopZ
MKTKVYKIEGMDCDACSKMIELDLEDAGIASSCNYAKKTLEINEGEDLKKVKEIVKKSGYKLS